ncbi:hypothetical protein Trco_006643 [Trichoderma cornu-damae]|uniref:AGC-kinase C-terminal domain-containing protein n=1 Tax=Trichoderma cornu-damae TaxID=654480 RepID=A0A9P8QH63_9HYPO|nr:hypothetical protein Trco_006643 [Trichoderma cornu-damae]
MLSHLRFHRRGPSNPTSPAPDQPSPSSHSSHQQSPLNPDSTPSPDAQLAPSASASLPPIARVTSSEVDLDALEEKRDVEKPPLSAGRPPQAQRSGYITAVSGFIGGVALRNYQRNVEAQQAGDGSKFDGQNQGGPYPAPISNNIDSPTRPAPQMSDGSRGAAPFSTGAPPYSSTSSQRLSRSTPSTGVLSIEPQKGKKGLPFLKNPMSTLLLRRKNNQSTPAVLPLPLSSRSDDPAYDPRIRGTRVHDFSAPRRRTNAPANDTVAIRSASLANIALEPGLGPRGATDSRGPVVLDGQQQRRMLSSASDPARPESGSTNSHTIAQSSSVSSVRTGSSSAEHALPSDDYIFPAATSKTNDSAPLQANPSIASRATPRETDDSAMNAGSTRTNRSRNVSLSSVPRHMKSTSSRFSFDMIGAAKQEKLLEERHRQRELDKKAAQGEPSDSRFDDFDEDAFDYDAMMDDDGLEERIPGINADLDEEDVYFDDRYHEQEAPYMEDEMDPDDDQENFAGFAFQRSNATSSSATPQSGTGMAATPSDTDGEAIGRAVTKDAPGLPTLPLSPEPNSIADRGPDAEAPGPGIGGADVSASSQTPGTERGPGSHSTAKPPAQGAYRGIADDDLYFDEGMASFGGVFAEDLAGGPVDDGVPFDESIFDNDDTDQYGRPLPGAFALAKSAREGKNSQEMQKQETTTTKQEPETALPQSSEQPDVAQAATQAAASVDTEQSGGNAGDEASNDLAPTSETTIVAPQPTPYGANPIVAYQAALAAAALKAAESGKFERTMPQSPTEAGNHGRPSARLDGMDDLDDFLHDDYGYVYGDLGDFEMDDDAIIAEANASALANDSDGWYGQEFGFYAAPVNSYGSHSASSSLDDYGYAAGGFFGPKGASNPNRSISGRVVSREPNLTPITERSEYSNRNSLMSLGMPPIGGTPVLQSPGLAQLTMMADRGDDQMNLSALLRLRSRAWGGSQASLASSKDGSPRSERGDTPGSPRGPGFPASLPPSTVGHTRKNSAFSIVSRDSDAGSAPASPTLTMPLSSLAHSSSVEPAFTNREADLAPAWGAVSTSPFPTGSNLSPEGISPLSDSHHPSAPAVPGTHPHATSARSIQDAASPEKGHQRQKRSTDSISYMMEEESGETRWVMERRRTGEFGQVEILEREVVEGGRI